MRSDRRDSSIYIRNFIEANVPVIEELDDLDYGARTRARRLIQIYWAILFKAGYSVNSQELAGETEITFDPGYNQNLRQAVHGDDPSEITTIQDMVSEFEAVWDFARSLDANDPRITTRSGNPMFAADDCALLEFLNPRSGAGTGVIQAYRQYHDQHKVPDDDPSHRLKEGSDAFKKRYKQRMSVERVIGRAKNHFMLEEPRVTGRDPVRQHVFISLCALLLTSLACHNMGYSPMKSGVFRV